MQDYEWDGNELKPIQPDTILRRLYTSVRTTEMHSFQEQKTVTKTDTKNLNTMLIMASSTQCFRTRNVCRYTETEFNAQ